MIDRAGVVLHSHVPQVKGRIRLRIHRPAYWGSVRFFKHVILVFVCLLILTPWAVVLRVRVSGETKLAAAGEREKRLRSVNSGLEADLAAREEALRLARREEERLLEQIGGLERLLEQTEDRYSFVSAYEGQYPDLRVAAPAEYEDSTKTVYLTFDDGPGGNTRQVLDILGRYGIKATFFVVGYTVVGREETLRRAVEEGHNIGIHSDSHVYREIYESPEAFLEDFSSASARIEEAAGIKPDIFRFPGGSLNGFTERWGNTLASEMLARGYRYYDWNAGSGDAAAGVSADTIFSDVIRQVHSHDYSVVLMHDGGGNRSETVKALPAIIERLRAEGYRFGRLTNRVRPVVFEVSGYNRG